MLFFKIGLIDLTTKIAAKLFRTMDLWLHGEIPLDTNIDSWLDRIKTTLVALRAKVFFLEAFMGMLNDFGRAKLFMATPATHTGGSFGLFLIAGGFCMVWVSF